MWWLWSICPWRLHCFIIMNYTLYRHLWIAYIFTVDVYFAEKLFVEKFNFLLISVTTLLLLGMSFFYYAMLCIRGTSHGPVSVRLSQSRCSTKTAKHRITQTTPHDSPGTLVLWCKDLREIRPGSPPTGAPNAGGVGQNRRLSTNSRLYLENGTR